MDNKQQWAASLICFLSFWSMSCFYHLISVTPAKPLHGKLLRLGLPLMWSLQMKSLITSWRGCLEGQFHHLHLQWFMLLLITKVLHHDRRRRHLLLHDDDDQADDHHHHHVDARYHSSKDCVASIDHSHGFSKFQASRDFCFPLVSMMVPGNI